MAQNMLNGILGLWSPRWLDQGAGGNVAMRVPVTLMATVRWGAMIVAAMLYAGAPASAGSGAASIGDINQFKSIVCNTVTGIDISVCNSLIQRLPTVTVNQLVVEAAAILAETPAEIRSKNFSTSSSPAFDAGTLVSVNGSALSNPLAFIASPGQPTPTSPSNPAANSFLSARTTPATASPTTLNLTFDFLPRTNSSFTAGQDVGDITLPLVVADAHQNVKRDVTATLHILGTGNGSGVTTDVIGNLSGMGSQTYQLGDLGIKSSLNFTKGHLDFDLELPLLITSDIAPAYVFSASGFLFDAADGLFDGIDPIASFLDASFLDNAGDLLMAANADLAIAFDGSTIISAPLPAVPEPSTLAVLGGGLLGLALLFRRRIRTA